MKLRAWCLTLGEYFVNKIHPAFIEDPFKNIVREEKGQEVPERKVGYRELFYDLFVVAVLSVYTSEITLSDGESIGSYVLFFSAIWTIWASQTVFDIRYGTKDGMMWIFGYLQLCVYGAWAAISGNFHLSFDSREHASTQDHSSLSGLYNHYFQSSDFVELPGATQRSFTVASAVFASSRIVLLLQYTIVLYFARKHRRELKPIYYTMLGCLFSAILWFTAMGLSFSNTQAGRIARVTLWIVGLILEVAGMILGASVQSELNLDLLYWAERFGALTLIVLGEGIIGLFEAFQKLFHGAYASTNSSTVGSIAGTIITAIAMYRLLYYLYFSQTSHHIRGGPLQHACWGAIHYPMHLALLLLTQCIIHDVLSLNVYADVPTFDSAYMGLGLELAEQPAAARGNVTAWAELMLHSPPAINLERVVRNFGVDWYSRVGNMVTVAGSNITLLQSLFITERFELYETLFSNYGFDPPESTSELANQAAGFGASNNWTGYSDVFDEYSLLIVKPVFIAQQYGVTVLGGFFVCLAGLLLLQHPPMDHRHERYWKFGCWYKFLLGIVFLLLSLLYIGPFYAVGSLFTGPAAPIYPWINSNWYLPTLFLVAATAGVVDFGVFIWRKTEDRELAALAGAPSQSSPVHEMPVLEALPSSTSREDTAEKRQKWEKTR